MNGKKLILVAVLVVVFLQANQSVCASLQDVASQLDTLRNTAPRTMPTNVDIMKELRRIRAMLEQRSSVLLPSRLLSRSSDSPVAADDSDANADQVPSLDSLASLWSMLSQ
ncbi:unnamed protein product [Xylocopa violacea]|uniref:Uncharacterized protein n=1 Tax=Xylocopa violacea TaxID=135666 RepID=A0ABP1N1U9_XYLVO